VLTPLSPRPVPVANQGYAPIAWWDLGADGGGRVGSSS